MSGPPPSTVYPLGAVPIHRPVMAPPGSLPRSALAPGASWNNLLQTITRAPQSIQRPMFAATSRQTPLPAGYPAPIYVDPVMTRIKYMTDTFHAAATNDPTFYKIYCGVFNAQSHYSAHPDLVFFLRLHLQVSWLDLLQRHNRQNEVEGDPIHLINERKELIGWLVKRDKTLKSRAGQYLTGQLARFAPLDFDPSQVSPVIVLLDHLYMLENKLFFDPKEIRAPARHEYRVKVVTYLNYEGGDAKIIEDVNLDKRIDWYELQRTLSILTQNIQAAQLTYNYGFQTGGYHGKWVYWANETTAPEGWSRDLDSAAQMMEMKGMLEQGLKIYIMHTKQEEIGDNLEMADALGLGLDRPLESCIPLPPGYTSIIMGDYPNKLEFSLLSGGSTDGGPAPKVEHRRGGRSAPVTQHRHWLRKQKQKARAFEIRGKRA
ncbi:hypothetical protein E4T44_03404 [Aureobasidium sp. EXF-8845]|nr:hypothetical protein E4T44_03404 [Aureobasidium sp. EXF-8845]KAI4854995.1 hypothetical protein E4T45_03575 [Aureobasidium sp. EXF-8846]